MKKPELSYKFYKLPLTTLHCINAGSGDPLIIVPATISELNNWKSLVEFLGQKFDTYFFELPGHGKSTPFKEKFSSDLVAETVRDLADHLGFIKFNLMGFSFGGILALKSFHLLSERVEKIIFIAPCVSHKAVIYSKQRMATVKTLLNFFKKPSVRSKLLSMMHNERTVDLVVKLLMSLGKVEKNIKLRKKLLILSEDTLDVLENQVDEILNVEFEDPAKKYTNPCYFAMSVNDPLLNFKFTENFLNKHFENVTTKKFYFHYHQPPKPFTFKKLNKDYGKFLDIISK